MKITHKVATLVTTLISFGSLINEANGATYGFTLPDAPNNFQWEVTSQAGFFGNDGSLAQIGLIGDLSIGSTNLETTGYSPGQVNASISGQTLNLLAPTFSSLVEGEDFFEVSNIVIQVNAGYGATRFFNNDAVPGVSVDIDGTDIGSFNISGNVAGGANFTGSDTESDTIDFSMTPLSFATDSFIVNAGTTIDIADTLDLNYTLENINASFSRTLSLDPTATSVSYADSAPSSASVSARIIYQGTLYKLDNAPVIPEPSSTFLIGVSALGILARRKRSK